MDEQTERTAVSHHEAAHSVLNYLHGWRLGPIVLRTQRPSGHKLRGMPSATQVPSGETQDGRELSLLSL